MTENRDELCLLHLAALFAFLDEPVSRRSLLQLTESDANTLDESLDKLSARKCMRRVDASHWQRLESERIREFLAAAGKYCSSDPLLQVLLPESGLSDLERSQMVLDILRKHTLLDKSAAVLVCINILFSLAAKIPWDSLNTEDCRQYLQIIKHIQSISIMFSYRQSRAAMLLQPARRAAQRLGDERSLIMLDLMEGCQTHLSHLHNLASPHVLLRTVMERVQALGDSDIMASTATGVGLVYFMQGEYEKAIAFMKQCPEGFFVDSFDYLEEVRIRYMGSAACALGRLDLGLGPMLSSLFEARERNNRLTVKWHKVHLSDQLLRVGMLEQGMELLTDVLHCSDPESEIKLWFWSCRNLAYYHFQCGRIAVAHRIMTEGMLEQGMELLTDVLHCSDPESEIKLWFWSCRNLAYYHFQCGRIAVAHRIMTEGMRQCIKYGAKRPYYGFTWIFEMLGTFKRMGLKDIPGYGYEEEIQAGMQSPNPLFRSAALRVHVTTSQSMGTPLPDSERLLRKCIALAEEAHGVLDAARACLALARLLYSQGRKTGEADVLYNKAWRTLWRFHQYDCPAPQKHLLSPEQLDIPDAKNCLTHFARLLTSLTQSETREDIFQNIMSSLCAALGLERGCLITLSDTNKTQAYSVVSSYYIPVRELERDLHESLIATLAQCENSACARLNNAGGSALLLKLPSAQADGKDLFFFAHCLYLHHRIDLQDEDLFVQIAKIAASELHKALLWHQKIHNRESTALERIRQSAGQGTQEEFFYGPSMQRLIEQTDTAALSDAPILILGETGVGKENLARRIHNHSGRSGLFVAVNPAGMTESLFESECFGHEKGAFTGAHKQKIGLFELAHHGTLFIDELGEIPLSLQVKLLRVLQEKTFLRIGGTQEIHSDFRLVTATNRNLQKMVEEGRFREDLYYRVAVIPVSVPSLRQRKEDIPMLARLFIQQFATRYQRAVTDISPEEMEQLTTYRWPGNIRELKSVIERAVILSSRGNVHFELSANSQGTARPQVQQSMQPFFASLPTLDELQRQYIDYVLEKTRGKINGPNGALQILGMKRSTLYKKLHAYGLDAISKAYGTAKPES